MNALHENSFTEDWCLVRSVLKVNCPNAFLLKTQFIAPLNRMNGIAGFIKMDTVKTTMTLSWDYFSNHNIGYGFDHESPNLTSFCGGFVNEQSTVITQEGWRTQNMTTSRLLMSLTNTLFGKLQETLWKG
jgi:hypothetical protein